jgi:hypothetical protein
MATTRKPLKRKCKEKRVEADKKKLKAEEEEEKVSLVYSQYQS